MAFLAMYVAKRFCRCKVPVDAFCLMLLFLSFVPWLDLWASRLAFYGEAVVYWIYFFGFFLSVIFGRFCNVLMRDQSLSFFFGVLLIAGILSVGLQLNQWLGLEILDLLTMGGGRLRPHANLGQANNLSTLLVLAVLGVFWFVESGYFSVAVSRFIGLFLVFGIALTGSRTGMLCMGFIILSVFLRWRLWELRSTRLGIVSVFLGYAFFLYFIPVFSGFYDIQGIDHSGKDFVRTNVSDRFEPWRVLLTAVEKSPWFGYGVNQVPKAYLHALQGFGDIGLFFQHSHNILLDLSLWFGVPVAVVVFYFSFSLLRNLWSSVKNGSGFLLFVGVFCVFIHSMVEMPLYYCYILFPLGFLIGVSGVTTQCVLFFLSGRVFFGALVTVVVLGLYIAYDYFKVEEKYMQATLQRQGFFSGELLNVPKLYILNQWASVLECTVKDSGRGLCENLDDLRAVAYFMHSPFYFYALAELSMRYSRNDEARFWMHSICRTASYEQCDLAKYKCRAFAAELNSLTKSGVSVNFSEVCF